MKQDCAICKDISIGNGAYTIFKHVHWGRERVEINHYVLIDDDGDTADYALCGMPGNYYTLADRMTDALVTPGRQSLIASVRLA
jgi:hypothetical protein